VLFDGPLAGIQAYVEQKAAEGQLRRMRPAPVDAWRADEPQVVLRRSTGLELGSTSTASLGLLLWHDRYPVDDGVLLVGPDLLQAGATALPFALLLVARVRPAEDQDYLRYREMREASLQVRLRGVMWRTLPRRQSVWCRIDGASLAGGLDARTLGSAFVASLGVLPFVDAVQVIMVTAGQEAVEQLRPTADQVLDIVDALSRMHEVSLELNCEGCEYGAVCDSAEDLRRIHARLSRGRGDP
jgi:CO dehydrogenase/acetyl-CoA synthase beta subunit